MSDIRLKKPVPLHRQTTRNSLAKQTVNKKYKQLKIYDYGKDTSKN